MNPIDKVRERLDGGRLWLKGDLGSYDLRDAPTCLQGACYASTSLGVYEVDIHDVIAGVIAEQFPDFTEVFDPWGDVYIPAFNDHERTTWPDVELVLDKASIKWDEQNS